MVDEPPRSLDDLELIANIADDLPVGVWVASAPDGGLVYANRAFAEILGMKAQAEVAAGGYSEPYGIHTRDGRLYPEDRLPFVRALVEKETVCVDDLVIHRHDGRKAYVRAFARPMFGPAGEVTHVAIAFIDISREVKAYERAETIEERLNNVFAHTPVIVWAHDAEGMITLVQGRGLDLLGWRSDDIVGRSVFELYKDYPDIVGGARRALNGESFMAVVQFGSLAFQTSQSPIRDRSGKVTRVVGVSTEISDQRAKELRLARAERVASLGMLAASIGHEINSPLSYVIGNLERLTLCLRKVEGAVPEEVLRELRECVSEAQDGAARAATTVRGLKDHSRADVDRQLVDVRDVVRRALQLVGGELRYRARVSQDIPKLPKILVNEGQLTQVVINLLQNAAQAIVEGHADANEVVLRGRCEAGWVTLEIRDTGTGMTPEVRAHIFEPFFTTKPVGEGSGLGLSICQGLLKGMGGGIECESVVGAGTVVRLRVPVAPDVARSNPPVRAADAQPAGRARILVIDDDARLARSIKALLEDAHDVDIETSAVHACSRLLGGEQFDVVLCDLMMREMNGMDLYEKLAAERPSEVPRIVFMTGGAFTGRARDFLERVDNTCLDKPFARAELLRVIAERMAGGGPRPLEE